jgi:hypothetical protein
MADDEHVVCQEPCNEWCDKVYMDKRKKYKFLYGLRIAFSKQLLRIMLYKYIYFMFVHGF